jgi:23S rRNA pseudouridine1911/1915/1917 synthase
MPPIHPAFASLWPLRFKRLSVRYLTQKTPPSDTATHFAFFTFHSPRSRSPKKTPLVAPLDTRSQSSPRLATFNVVAESIDWIVVEKPPFVEVHPSKPNGRKTLWDGLRELLAYEIVNGGQVSIINRLDRETSGLTLVAKHRDAARAFCLEMEARRITKEYLALVWGWPAHDAFTVEAPILRQGDRQPSTIYLKQMVHPEGALAATDFRVERRFTLETSAGSRFALVRAFPKTGRMHQIRVHLAHAGYPIVGDKIYGPDEGCYLEFIQTGWTPALERRLLLPRHALHSAALAVPSHGLAWRSSLPPDLKAWADMPGTPSLNPPTD